MNPELKKYIDHARTKQRTDADIRERLIATGWQAPMVDAALEGDDMPPPPPPVHSGPISMNRVNNAPMAVTNVASIRGFEYSLMFLALWGLAGSLIAMLNFFAAGESSNTNLSLPITIILVSLPIFVFFFLRLKKAELKEPSLLQDPSRRRAIQITQLVTFVAVIIHLITLIYGLLKSCAGTPYSSCRKTDGTDFVHFLITLGIAGGIFAYYWIVEHKNRAL